METLTTIDTMASDLLEKMPEILEKGIEYGGDLFMRFWNYAIFLESFGAFTATMGFVICILLVKRGINGFEDSDGFFEFMIVSFSTVFAIFFFFAFFKDISDLLLAIFLPEIYIINYFQ